VSAILTQDGFDAAIEVTLWSALVLSLVLSCVDAFDASLVLCCVDAFECIVFGCLTSAI
jgi:hypothetical protein